MLYGDAFELVPIKIKCVENFKLASFGIDRQIVY